MKKMRRDLLNDRADGSTSISMLMFILLVFVLILFSLEVFSGVVNVTSMNQAADTIAKQIQIEGAVNKHTFQLFETTMAAHKSVAAPAMTVTILDSGETITKSPAEDKKIQLGGSFTVAITGKIGLGGYQISQENAPRINVPISVGTVGVSERYWKDV